MFATTVFPPAFLRASFILFALLQKFLMAAGIAFLVGLLGLQAGHSGLIEGLKTLIPSTQVTDDEERARDFVAPAGESEPVLSPTMRGALDYVARR
jgi:hypothetical protein